MSKEFETQSSFDKFYKTTEGYFQWEEVGKKVKISNHTGYSLYHVNRNMDDRFVEDLLLEENSNLDDEYMKEICSFIKCENPSEMNCWNPIEVKGHCCKICGKSILFEIDKSDSVKQFMYFSLVKINEIKKLYNNLYGISFSRITMTPTIKPTYQLVVFQSNNSLTYNTTIIESIINQTIPIFNLFGKSEINILYENASKNILFWSVEKKVLLILLCLIILLAYMALKFNLIEKIKNYTRFIYYNVPEENFIIRYKNDNVNISRTKEETVCLLLEEEEEECNSIKNI
ncbi:Hypothetical protein SRAE_2000389500 [Strongyloides ratti]|uniref:Uncharacterized protein n=1 Tax=Strongyloides ratti TaxID=34506 RepID=A0A090LP15_STRRB|nr:Hypothetical protein SRAE_2000389500 [Strongyloides ratti]CEF69245.1 Hypothetical protein SRAE_2000389500 [Strongyloides ratti]